MDYAIFLHVNTHPRAIFLGLGNREELWNQIPLQARHFAKDPYWQHSELVSRRSAPLSALFRRIGDCRFPTFLTPEVSIELLDCSARRVLCGRRVDFNRGCMAPGNLDSQEDKPDRSVYWNAVARNADRAKRRWLGARSRSHLEPFGPVTFSDGTALDVPPNVEVATNVSSSTPRTHSRVHSFDS